MRSRPARSPPAAPGIGLTDRNVARLLNEGTLVRRHRGVYLDGCVAATPRTELWAAQLALGPAGFLQPSDRGRAARPARRQRSRARAHGHPPPHPEHRRPPASIAPPARPTRFELRDTDGLRHSSYARVLIELAPRETAAELDRLITEGARRRLLDLDQIDTALKRRNHIPGRAASSVRSRATGPRRATSPPWSATSLRGWRRCPASRRRSATCTSLTAGRSISTGRPIASPSRPTAVRFTAPRTTSSATAIKDAWLQRHAIRAMRVSDFRFAHDRSGHPRRPAGAARARGLIRGQRARERASGDAPPRASLSYTAASDE